MNIIWIAAIFLSRVLQVDASTGICTNCLDMPIHRITSRDSTSVSCPNMTGQEVKYQLWRNKEEIRSVIWTPQNHTVPEFQAQNPNRSARFILSRLAVNDTGIYICNAEQRYPPPYIAAEGTRNMVVVQELPPEVKGCPAEKASQVWIWVVLGLVAAYSIIMTGVAVGFWHNLTNKQNLQHDYMNMKPRALRKKQGIQHPVRNGKY
ncbi:hypothetical protein COCON_G00042930 [Conger conger]|uniref:Ig-like domain-containing protein n=1 Tax=Conger conger TaxID=82655 RepID=A0A9Q1I411_CONCO|nr:T-cell-specific surface glycoprotein CD28 [Conger conger]XP_061091919.1 T-cell-specific surface glycoprotein CD28 [Conger conger]KAJ8281774.1 hypothetical protein COCON_G00042930 [Conger conger]